MSFRRRKYPEVIDNLLTSMIGGVAAEAHPFPPAQTSPFTHALLKPPAGSVVSVYGTRNDEAFLFEAGTDFALAADGLTVAWMEGGRVPDDGTLVHVNYLPRGQGGTVNDVHVGSVMRTLSESVGLEIARLYAELQAVYDAGFIDTAGGRSLDNVVSLLGVERVVAGRFSGDVELTRASGSRGDIHLPAGTRVITADGNVEYETTVAVTLLTGQNTIRVVARDVEANSEGLAADSLTVLAKPVAGIAGVTNPAPTTLGTKDESDDELRARAKQFLNGSERATLGAIQDAISRQQVMADVTEPADRPGEIDVEIHADVLPPELLQRIATAIHDVRPAGIKVNLPETAQAPARINLALRIATADGLLEQDLRGAQEDAREAIDNYFQKLTVKSAGSINKVVSLVLGVDGIEDVHIMSASLTEGVTTTTNVLLREEGVFAIADTPTVLGELTIVDPGLATLVRAVVTYPVDEPPPDSTAIAAALSTSLSYLNDANASELSETPTQQELDLRTVTYSRLLYALPLPVADQPRGALIDFDQPPAGAPPLALPTEGDIVPYSIEFIVTTPGGVSHLLRNAAASGFALTSFERLSQDGVEIAEVASA